MAKDKSYVYIVCAGQMAKYEKYRLCQLSLNPASAGAVPPAMRTFCRQKAREQARMLRLNMACSHAPPEPAD